MGLRAFGLATAAPLGWNGPLDLAGVAVGIEDGAKEPGPMNLVRSDPLSPAARRRVPEAAQPLATLPVAAPGFQADQARA